MISPNQIKETIRTTSNVVDGFLKDIDKNELKKSEINAIIAQSEVLTIKLNQLKRSLS